MRDAPAADDDLDTHAATGRDRRITRLRERHWLVLLVSTTVLLLAVCLEIVDGRQVAFTGWPDFPLPELCSSRAWFGVSCPGCGLTRSFIHLAHGRFGESVAAHRVGWILALVIVLQLPYRTVSLCQSPVGGLDSRWPGWISIALIAMLIGNWLLDQLTP